MLGCSRNVLDKVVKAYKEGGTTKACTLSWNVGRPMKFHGLTQKEMDAIVCKTTLVKQAGMSCEARAT